MRAVLYVSVSALGLAAAVLAGCSTEPAFPPEEPRDWARPLRAVEFERTEERIERGRYLASAVMQCSKCHGELDRSQPGEPPLPGREFVGRIFWQDSAHRIVAPNLTPDRETGAGRWTDDMLLRAIREGVGHDGRALNRWMPYQSFRSLSDEDAASIVVFLRSLEPVRNELPKTHLSAERRRRTEEDLEPLTEPVPMPDTVDAVARGRYYIGLADCVGCHTSWYTDYNPGLLAGGNRVSDRTNWGERVFSSNITPDRSGIGGLDSTGFIALMRSGRGGSMDATMPWTSFAQMSDRDLGAVFRALLAVPPASHWVSNAPPSFCAICEQEHGMGDRNRRVRPEGISLDTRALDALTGVYVFEPEAWTIRVTREGNRLYAAGGEDEPIEIIPVEGDRCLVPGGVAPLSYERDESGRVIALISEELPPVRFEKVPSDQALP